MAAAVAAAAVVDVDMDVVMDVVTVVHVDAAALGRRQRK